MFSQTNTPTKVSRSDLIGIDGPKCRTIFRPTEGGWSEPAIFEWELAAESWTDEHPHTEYNYLIEGQLFVQASGTTLEINPGDLVQVPAGVVGRYWAPKYARMLAIYGPSNGGSTRRLGYEKLDGRQP